MLAKCALWSWLSVRHPTKGRLIPSVPLCRTSTNPELSQYLDGPDPHASAKLNAVNLALMSKPAYWHTVLSVLQTNVEVFKQPVSKQETHGSTRLIVLSAANTYADALPRDRKGLEEARAHTQAQIVTTSSRSTLVRVPDSSHEIEIDQPGAVVKGGRASAGDGAVRIEIRLDHLTTTSPPSAPTSSNSAPWVTTTSAPWSRPKRNAPPVGGWRIGQRAVPPKAGSEPDPVFPGLY